MARTNNYLIQARQAKQRFLTYDSQALIRKLNLKADEDFLYVPMLCQTYRIRRTTGDIDRFNGEAWVDANSYEEVMTLLDLEDYIATKDKAFADYEDKAKWKRMMLTNIAKAGYFSSDRTIAEYNRDIWKMVPSFNEEIGK